MFGLKSLDKRISEYPDRLAAAIKTYQNTPDSSTFRLSGQPDRLSLEIAEISKNLRLYEFSLRHSRKIFQEIKSSITKDQSSLLAEINKPSSSLPKEALLLAKDQLAQSAFLACYLLREIDSQLSAVVDAKRALKLSQKTESFADFLQFKRELAFLNSSRENSLKKMGRL